MTSNAPSRGPAPSPELVHRTRVAIEALRWRCDPAAFPFESTAQVEPEVGIVGQDDAVDALAFGLEIHAAGQNIFVRGLSGTGRLSLVKRLVRQIRPQCPTGRDHCYVQDFERPDHPRLITLARGQGEELRQRVDELARFIREDLPKLFSSDAIKARREALEQRAQEELEKITAPFEEEIRAAGLALVRVQAGQGFQLALLPVIEGNPVPFEQVEMLLRQDKISQEDFDALREKIQSYGKQLQEVAEHSAEVNRATRERLKDLFATEVRSALGRFVREIEQAVPGEEVGAFLAAIVEDVVRSAGSGAQENPDFTRRYRVNVLATQRDGECPVVVENAPTMQGLLGTIEVEVRPGEPPRSDHMMIRAGSLLAADGGFLILDAREVLSEPGAWKALVRTLRTGRLQIGAGDQQAPWHIPTLKPDPIDIHVKVILIGNAEIYYLLDAHDPDFSEQFKVLVDFDTVLDRDERGVALYAGVLARVIAEEGLLPFDATAVAALAEHGARIAARRGKLTARFGRLSDIAREAVFLARKDERQEVRGEDVLAAIRRTKRRADLPARHFRQYVADGTIRVQIHGRSVGQVNGLAVTQAGPLTYGFPARISATIGPGTAGAINIEREAALSGAIHTKGFYILGGLLRYLLRTDHPLAFSASIAFEQSYGGIDGDSASGAEICCLLSALTDIPLRQDLAMTGAIDQMGHILPIGAANEKIEGFFDTCCDLGDPDGEQGVIIPAANVGDLMLREDVVAACEAGRFHVYGVATVHEALELLTGIPAGQRDATNLYPEGSLLARALEQARRYWEKVAAVPSS